jgi:hypothetical protein
MPMLVILVPAFGLALWTGLQLVPGQPNALAALLAVAAGASTTDTAVRMAVGTQVPYSLDLLVETVVTQPVAWLGLLGALLVLTELLGRRVSKPQALALFTVLPWASLLFLGSRMPMTGFPQCFGRDGGIPLAILAAVCFVTILRSLGVPRPSSSRPWWCYDDVLIVARRGT